jgi:hypothetical protein
LLLRIIAAIRAANPQMTLSVEHMYLAMAAAIVTVALIVWRAPSLQAGYYRLNLLLNTLGIAIVFAAWAAGLALFVWGVVAGSKELIYISFLPMVLGGGMYNLITRRHRTWWGVFGFSDGRERWRSFWDETRNLWGLPPRSRPAPGGSARNAAPGQSASGPGPGPAPSPAHTRSFSFSFGSRGRSGGAGLLGPIITFAATRLATDHITVFPNDVRFAIELDASENAPQNHVGAARQILVVRRRDGGYLQLVVRSDLAFIETTPGPRRFDGSYTISVDLVATRLTRGPFSGTIFIDTGDPVEPKLTVPVAGIVR